MISFSIKMNFILSLQIFDFSKGLKNVETVVVNEPSMFDPKKAKTVTLSGIIYRYLKSPLGIKLYERSMTSKNDYYFEL